MARVTDSDSVAQDQLQAFVRRIESLEDEINALNGDKSEVYKEAKGNGFDTKVLRKVIADRRKDASERNEFDAVYQLYWDAVHGFVRAHVENIEQFAADAFGITEVLRHGAFPEHDADGVIIEPQATPATRGETAAYAVRADLGRREGTNPGVDDVAPPPAHAPEQPGNDHGSVSTPDEGGANSSEIPHPVIVPPPAITATGDGDSTDPSSPDAVPGATNVTPFRSHNPSTHFLNSKGLPRLHGCLKAEACGGSARSLCYTCGRHAEQASHQGGAA